MGSYTTDTEYHAVVLILVIVPHTRTRKLLQTNETQTFYMSFTDWGKWSSFTYLWMADSPWEEITLFYSDRVLVTEIGFLKLFGKEKAIWSVITHMSSALALFVSTCTNVCIAWTDTRYRAHKLFQNRRKRNEKQVKREVTRVPVRKDERRGQGIQV